MEESKIVVKETENSSEIAFELNGKPIKLTVAPTIRLVEILRDELKQTGTKISCGIGRCGACSVLLNGNVVNSCLTMAYQVNGASIQTIEGLGNEEDGLDIIQRAFLEEGGFQCGYCTAGMIIATKALLDKVPHPSEEQVVEALSGNLCRCTGYGGIVRAVEKAASEYPS